MVIAAAFVDGHRERVERTLRLDEREERRARVEGEARLEARAGRHPPRKDVARGERASRTLQDEQRASRTLTPAEVLRHAVVPARIAPRAEENTLLERRREARVGKQARTSRAALGEEIRPAFRRCVPLIHVLHPLGDHGNPEVGRHPIRCREPRRPRARGRLQARDPVAVEPVRNGHGATQRDGCLRPRQRPFTLSIRPQHVTAVTVLGIAIHHHHERQQLGDGRQRVAEQAQITSHGVETRFGDGEFRWRASLPKRTRVTGQFRRALHLDGGRPVERDRAVSARKLGESKRSLLSAPTARNWIREVAQLGIDITRRKETPRLNAACRQAGKGHGHNQGGNFHATYSIKTSPLRQYREWRRRGMFSC